MYRLLLSSLLLSLLVAGCSPKQPQSIEEEGSTLFAKENLLAWCVVPFDVKERNPKERVAMLKELGFTKFAYDWREKHLSSFPEEVAELQEAGIELSSVWFWVNDGETIIDANNERLLQMIDSLGTQTEFWLGVNQGVFEGMTEEEHLAKAEEIVEAYHKRAKDLGSTIALYNHGDWFGNPSNQIRVIKSLGHDDIRIVYNFHHAHDQLEEYPELLTEMLPYLSTVNLNGMRKGGPKILPIGSGEEEFEMMRLLEESGFAGTIGILGHVDTADVEVVLRGNLAGLAKF